MKLDDLGKDAEELMEELLKLPPIINDEPILYTPTFCC